MQCIPGDFACYQYRGAQSITDAYGSYSIILDVTEDENDLDILLNLRGENFTHTIDLDTHRNSTNNQMTQNILLEQNPPPSGVFLGLVASSCCLPWCLFRSCYELVDDYQPNKVEWIFMGMKQVRMLECPTCKQMIAQHELVMHLIVEHDMEAFDAGELAGKVMRRT